MRHLAGTFLSDATLKRTRHSVKRHVTRFTSFSAGHHIPKLSVYFQVHCVRTIRVVPTKSFSPCDTRPNGLPAALKRTLKRTLQTSIRAPSPEADSHKTPAFRIRYFLGITCQNDSLDLEGWGVCPMSKIDSECGAKIDRSRHAPGGEDYLFCRSAIWVPILQRANFPNSVSSVSSA